METTDNSLVVQPGLVSSGTESKTQLNDAGVKVEEKSSETPITKADIDKLIKEQVAQFRTQFEQEKEELKRASQSAKDKALKEINRAKAADTERFAVIEAARQTNPELAEKLELQRLKVKEQLAMKEAQDVDAESKLEDFNKDFRTRIQKALKKLDVDPEDKGINWGDIKEDPLDRLDKILESATIVSIEGKKKKVDSDVEAKIAEAIKKTEERVRKELGFDSVDTKNTQGAGTDADFIKAYSENKLNSPADHARARKLLRL